MFWETRDDYMHVLLRLVTNRFPQQMQPLLRLLTALSSGEDGARNAYAIFLVRSLSISLSLSVSFLHLSFHISGLSVLRPKHTEKQSESQSLSCNSSFDSLCVGALWIMIVSRVWLCSPLLPHA